MVENNGHQHDGQNAKLSALQAAVGGLGAKVSELLARPAADLTDEDIAAIAAVIPDDIATRVADELQKRLAS